MDLQAIENAIDEHANFFITNYFKKNKVWFDESKNNLLAILGSDDVRKTNSLPFFLPFLKNNFLELIKISQDFIGFILLETGKIHNTGKFYLIWVKIKYYIFPRSRFKLKKLKRDYDIESGRIRSLFYQENIPRYEVDFIINQLSKYSKLNLKRNIQFTYLQICKELIFAIELLYHANDLSKITYFHPFMIQGYYYLNRNIETSTLSKITKYPLVEFMLNDLRDLYDIIIEYISKYNMIVIDGKKPYSDNPFSEITIKMIPHIGSLKNEIIINDDYDNVEKITDNPFDFLYYFLWMRKYQKEQVSSIETAGSIPSDIIDKILTDDKTIPRFGHAWNTSPDSEAKRNYKYKQSSAINNIFQEFLNTEYSIVNSMNKEYHLTRRIKSENIELVPYKK